MVETPAMLLHTITTIALAPLVLGSPQTGLGIFNVVTFPNEPCTSASGLNGTCLTTDECSSVSGTSSGTCASGFGVCCVVSKTCGESSSTNNTYLDQSTTTSSSSCTYTICRSSSDICQLRVDFETFVMSAPSTTTGTIGNCVNDNLIISNPSGPNPPMVCGTLSGQHMYLTASDSCHKLTATIGSTDTSTVRSWSMKVSQIECSNPLLPPAGCLQYHYDTTGYIQSFGWDGSDDATTTPTAYHQNNQKYNICFRRQEGYCSIEYFTPIAGLKLGSTGATAGTLESLYGDVACYEDFISIPGILASPTTFSTATAYATIIGDRICGLGWTNFPNPVATAATLVSYVKPFTVGVNFDASDELGAKEGNSGFSILYTQKACA